MRGGLHLAILPSCCQRGQGVEARLIGVIDRVAVGVLRLRDVADTIARGGRKAV